MLGFIEIIISAIGIYGFFAQNLFCIIVGLIGIVVCDFIDIFITGHNPTFIILACMFAIGFSIIFNNPLYGFTVALCGENLIMSIITLLAIGVTFIIGYFRKDKLIESEKYVELSTIVMDGLGVKNIDEAIEQTYSFYKEQGMDVEMAVDKNDKFITLSNLVMLGLDTDNIDEAIQETRKFYDK